MRKRDELTNPDSCLSRAHDDEMVFVLLARDPAAPATIHYWMQERVWRDLNKAEDAKLQEAAECAAIMDEERDLVRLSLAEGMQLIFISLENGNKDNAYKLAETLVKQIEEELEKLRAELKRANNHQKVR